MRQLGHVINYISFDQNQREKNHDPKPHFLSSAQVQASACIRIPNHSFLDFHSMQHETLHTSFQVFLKAALTHPLLNMVYFISMAAFFLSFTKPLVCTGTPFPSPQEWILRTCADLCQGESSSTRLHSSCARLVVHLIPSVSCRTQLPRFLFLFLFFL